ncbi:MAG: FkbM family methyltransferase [Rariglobus sp.]|nr:FkbM family methyltransferase [Rariglobus sp.]
MAKTTASSNLGTLRGIHIHYKAVGRSDADAKPDVVHSGYIDGNTGGGNVIMGGRAFEFYKQELFERTPATSEVRIPAIRLDDILAPFKSVKLIKIDCEGSEFPILLTSRLLHRVERIVGEYHEIEAHSMPCLDPGAVVPGFQDYRKEHLATVLEQHGFHVTFKESARCLGMFNAIRTRAIRAEV